MTALTRKPLKIFRTCYRLPRETKETAEECSNLVQVAAGDRLCQESPALQSWKVPHKHGRKYFPQALIHKKLDGHHLSFAGASGSACVANRGSPDSALGGLPLPPPFLACARHRKGRGGWSIADPCVACLDLALQADLTEEA